MNYNDIKIGELYTIKTKEEEAFGVAIFNNDVLEKGHPLNELKEEDYLGEIFIPDRSLVLCVEPGSWIYERGMKPDEGYYFLWGVHKFFLGTTDCENFLQPGPDEHEQNLLSAQE